MGIRMLTSRHRHSECRCRVLLGSVHPCLLLASADRCRRRAPSPPATPPSSSPPGHRLFEPPSCRAPMAAAVRAAVLLDALGQAAGRPGRCCSFSSNYPPSFSPPGRRLFEPPSCRSARRRPLSGCAPVVAALSPAGQVAVRPGLLESSGHAVIHGRAQAPLR